MLECLMEEMGRELIAQRRAVKPPGWTLVVSVYSAQVPALKGALLVKVAWVWFLVWGLIFHWLWQWNLSGDSGRIGKYLDISGMTFGCAIVNHPCQHCDVATLYLAMLDFKRLTSSCSCFNLSWRYLEKNMRKCWGWSKIHPLKDKRKQRTCFLFLYTAYSKNTVLSPQRGRGAGLASFWALL